MGDDVIDLILHVGVFREHFSGFYLGNDLVDEFEALVISGFHSGLAGQIHIALIVRGFLRLAQKTGSGLDHLCKTFITGNGRNGFHHRAAQLLGQQCGIDDGLLLLVDIRLIQGNHHGNAQLQQLGGEEQGAAQVGGIHDVDDGIGALVLNVGAGDAFFRGEGAHGVSAGQIHSDQIQIACVYFFNGCFFSVNGDTGPVANLFVAAGEGIIHGGLAGIGVACKSDSHRIVIPPDMVTYG